jgi:hypothetical protein
MPLTAKLAGLLEAIGPNDVRGLSPAARARLSDAMERVDRLLSETGKGKPRSGVLARLGEGQRAD